MCPHAPSRVPISIWIVEDSEQYRETVRDLIDNETDFSCAATFSTAEGLFEHLNEHYPPDVLLMDIGLPGMNGIEAVARLKGSVATRTTEVIMLTIHEDNDRILNAIAAGAAGYLSKSVSRADLIRGIREVLVGGAAMTPLVARRVLGLFTHQHAPRWNYDLTDREKDVLRGLVDAKSKKRIARDLDLSPHTVDTHVRNVYAKLHVNNAKGAVSTALRERLI
jgi:DNA-binding NarL/FixJ family response regulator